MDMPRRLGRLIAIILLAGGGGLGFLVYRKYRLKKAAAPEAGETSLSPEDEALLKLNQLFDSDLMRRGLIKEYYLRLSEILRIYLEKRFAILAVESTTDEIVKSFKKTDIPRPLKEKIASVLEAADLAKFAKWKPGPPEILRLNRESKEIVEEARPKTEPAAHGV